MKLATVVFGYLATTASCLVAPRHVAPRLTQQRVAPRVAPRMALVEGAALLQSQDLSAIPSQLLSFADQGGNLAGKFFQASLLPYVAFLYFLGYEKNQTPPLVKFGFAYLLLFVFATIPTGIISKSTWAESLADCDWLHGGAESLLTVTNILVLIGFRSALAGDTKTADLPIARYLAGAAVLAVAALIALGIPVFGFGAHDAFLGGLNPLPAPLTEPVNALSAATWAVHVSSVCEFLFAISLAVQYAQVTGNERWKGLAWGMIPSHASGICACTYHLFYNQAELSFLVTTQAGLTLLGNITLAIAAYRIAVSNGWTPGGALEGLPVVGTPVEEKPFDAADLQRTVDVIPAPLLGLEIAALSAGGALAVKYGSVAAVDYLTMPHPLVATALIVGIPVLTMSQLPSPIAATEEGEN